MQAPSIQSTNSCRTNEPSPPTSTAPPAQVPLNDTGYLLPWWHRLVLRSSIVIAVTLMSIFVPFFSTLVSLIGALCYWPLTLYFPYGACRRRGARGVGPCRAAVLV